MGYETVFSDELDLFSGWIRVAEKDLHRARQVSHNIYTWIQNTYVKSIDEYVELTIIIVIPI